MSAEPTVVLVDMDMVICDFEQQLLKEFRRKYPDERYIPLEERSGESAEKQYSEMRKDLGMKVMQIYTAYGFSQSLPEIPGACSALKEMNAIDGLEVFICSTPLVSYEFSLKEKCQWIEQHLGKDWLERIIHVSDKTLITGHLLIDDDTNIKGGETIPAWEHVVFTACHNVNSYIGNKKRLNNWTDGSWREIIQNIKK